MYGALTNLYFRFYDLRLGESTTATGRNILKHQCRKVSELLDGKYDVEFPLYETIQDAIDSGYTPDEAKDIALMGPVFNGKHQSESVVYGDTDSVDGSTVVDIDGVCDSIESHFNTLATTCQVVTPVKDTELLILNGSYDTPCIADEGWDYLPINLIYRHKTSKRRYKITTSSGKEVIVTEDHSLIRVAASDKLESCTPLTMKVGDVVIEQTL